MQKLRIFTAKLNRRVHQMAKKVLKNWKQKNISFKKPIVSEYFTLSKMLYFSIL